MTIANSLPVPGSTAAMSLSHCGPLVMYWFGYSEEKLRLAVVVQTKLNKTDLRLVSLLQRR